MSPAQFKQAFISRVRTARETAGYSQREMAEALHIPLKNYESYESRTPLPHFLILQFARAARSSIEELFGN